MIRTVIADDHTLVREGFKRVILLQEDMTVTGECGDADAVLACLESTPCDVLVLDIEMPGRNGLDLLPELRNRFPLVRILIQSVLPQEFVAMRALKAGAAGYISKHSAGEELVEAIRKVGAGKTYVSPAVVDQLVSNLPDARASEQLSEREFEVMRMIASGKTTPEIAGELFLSVNTVNTYRKRILGKLKLQSTTEMIHYAIRNKLVE